MPWKSKDKDTLTAAELGMIIMRGFAVYAVYRALSMAVETILPAIFFSQSATTANHFGFSFGMVVGYVLIALIFWKLAPSIGRRLTGEAADKKVSGVPYDQMMSLLFIGVGCFLLVNAISQLNVYIAQYKQYLSDPARRVFPLDPTYLFETIVFTGLSLWFILGARGISSLVMRVRDAGKDKKS